jgi:hypothetical protein
VGVVTLDDIRADRGLYPADILQDCETALILFAAAFHGKQDAIWIADAGIRATCVDTDANKLTEMKPAYPNNWEYVIGDAFEYATRTQRQWDVVSLDCFTNLFDRCAELLPLWCLLARKAVVLGIDERPLVIPDGWVLSGRKFRSNFNGGVYWAVIERA